MLLGALAIGVGLCIVSAWRAWDAHGELARTQSILAAADVRAASTRALPQRASARQAEAWNAIARRLNTPWPKLLDDLEAATPDEIAIVAVEPEDGGTRVRVLAEAKTLESLMAYAASLTESGRFAEAVLVKHETNEQDRNRPMRLTLVLRRSTRVRLAPAQEVRP